MANVALVHDDQSFEHKTGPGHPECPERVTAILNAFKRHKLDPPRLEIKPATRHDLHRVHDPNHIDNIEATCQNELPYPDADTVMSEGSWDAALLSAGGAISACNAVLDGEYDAAFSIMRPPGHHAESDRAMGFCLFNNVAIAAHWLREEAGLNKVAIIDWDVHHGNGTQHAFYNDDTVFYASIHQSPLFPGTGKPGERGKNNTNLNVVMPPHAPREDWMHAFEHEIVPTVQDFAPDFLLVSTGFDAYARDPLANQNLEVRDFADMTRLVKPICNNKLVTLTEGGYNLDALGECAIAHFNALQE